VSRLKDRGSSPTVREGSNKNEPLLTRGLMPRTGKLGNQDQFPKLRAVFHHLMSFPGFGEWQRTIDYRANMTALDELYGRDQFRFRSHHRSKNCEVAIENVA